MLEVDVVRQVLHGLDVVVGQAEPGQQLDLLQEDDDDEEEEEEVVGEDDLY